MKSVLVVFDCDVDEQWLRHHRISHGPDTDGLDDNEVLAAFFASVLKTGADMIAGTGITFPYGGNFRVMAIRGTL